MATPSTSAKRRVAAAVDPLVELEPLAVRAVVRSLDPDKRTADVIISTGARVLREGWAGPYYEELSLEKKHVRIKRLNNGAPLLNAHGSAFGVAIEDVVGVVEKATLEATADGGNVLVGTVRFARAEDDPKADQAFRKVKDGIVRNVSVGYRTFRLEKIEAEEGKPPVFRATDWEPYEVSLVPMGADDGAKVRGDSGVEKNSCRVVTRNVEPKKERPMDETRSEVIVEDRLAPDPEERTADVETAAEPNERDAGAGEERKRCEGLLLACRAARLPQSFALKLIADGVPLVDGQTRIFEELARRDEASAGPRPGAKFVGSVEVGDDPLVHVRGGIENALLHRVAPEFFKLGEIGRKYRGMSLLDVARSYLNARGTRTTDLSKMELAGLALGLTVRGGMGTTSDFPLLLGDVARKTLRAAYEEAEQTFKAIGRRITLSDFKQSARMQLGDAPALLEVKEHGEFTRGTIAESKEVLQLKTYGRVFAITRQALVNDETDAFSRVPTAFGRAARTLESNLVWNEITSNPDMGDGFPLFSPEHGNLDDVPSEISVDSLGKGRSAMRVQKGIDGVTVLNIVPKYLGVPAALETHASTFLVQITPGTAGAVNPFAGQLTLLVEPRLDADSPISWYLIAGPGTDVIEYAYLEGEEGPMVEDRVGFDIDGLEIKCRLDFGAKVVDWRGLWKNPGA